MGSFKTKARAIELLGKKQIRDSITALSEIMKNSYDADAEILRVEFNTAEKNPYILIYDTGCGMNAFDFENKWLILGTESKKISKYEKTPKGRTLMGEKGIGRLAVAKLGQQTIIISKKANSKWNMLFLNWNIFDNPLLMIEDVIIPTSYDFDINDLNNRLTALIQYQKQNLIHSAWQDKQYSKLRDIISNQIEELTFPISVITDVCRFIENYKSQGTVIFISSLTENWDSYLSPLNRDTNTDTMDGKNYDRLASFISDFQNVDNDFVVEVFYNNTIKEFNYDYNEQDFKNFDLKIEGYIEHGKFYGKLDARNADEKLLNECNKELKAGLEVTAGIKDWKKSDCGRFNIKFCHVELMRKNSGLTPEEYDQIKRKMSVSGGVAVYRDNVRILPYGEVENDFLGMEKRRTLSAGEYLFSHRNMFGRIDISSENNPLLEDKSSREGLIENEQYFYFLTTLQNLLIRIAKEYVTSATSDSKRLRLSYVNYNNEKAEQEERRTRAEKEEKKQVLQYIKDLTIQYKNSENLFIRAKNNIIDNITSFMKKYKIYPDIKYSELNEISVQMADELLCIRRLIIQSKNHMITVNPRYKSDIKEELLENIEIHNASIQDFVTDTQAKLEAFAQKEQNQIANLINNHLREIELNLSVSPERYIKDLLEDINGFKNKLYAFSEELHNYYSQREKETIPSIEIIASIKNDMKNIAVNSIDKLYKKNTNDLLKDIAILQNKCEYLLDNKPSYFASEGRKLYEELSKCNKQAEDHYISAINAIEYQFDHLNKKIKLLISYMQSNYGQETEELIGSLKEKNIELTNQIEVYSELANLGLSAEIVNHEFNQLFTNVFDAIKQMRYEPLNSEGKYLLKQIEVGFRAISERQNQLSPMYRSRSLYKKPILLKKMINDLYNFFESRIISNKIRFMNKIPEDVIIELSLSKIYPVLSNIIYNSIYWLTDREERIIMFHFVKERNSLYIEDSGPGIPTKFLKKIFDPFFSLKSDGRGLGLTIAKKVVESQGFSIDAVQSDNFKILDGACLRIRFSQIETLIERGE